jgi:bifunctional damage-control phosphatase, subfamily II, fusion protein
MRHDGYIGALGAFFGTEEPQAARPRMLGRGSLQENFSRLQFFTDRAVSALGVLDTVQDRMEEFPLLRDPAAYVADTIPMDDPTQRQYWLHALDASLPGLLKAVTHSMGTADDVARRLDEFSQCVLPLPRVLYLAREGQWC